MESWILWQRSQDTSEPLSDGSLLSTHDTESLQRKEGRRAHLTHAGTHMELQMYIHVPTHIDNHAKYYRSQYLY